MTQEKHFSQLKKTHQDQMLRHCHRYARDSLLSFEGCYSTYLLAQKEALAVFAA